MINLVPLWGLENEMRTVEYRVRSVTRYVVTRYETNDHTGGVETIGEYPNESYAYRALVALRAADPGGDDLPPHATPDA